MLKSRFSLTLFGQLILACLPNLVLAQSATSSVEIKLSASYDSLSRGYAPWRSVSLDVSKKLAPRLAIYGSATETSRFGLQDHQFTGGLYFPLGKRWLGHVEASFSPSHQVQSKWAIQGQLGRELGRGWVATVGLRHSAYNQLRSNLNTVTIERYWKKYRAAYTLYVSQQPGVGVTTSHSIQANYYYRERNSIGLTLAAGRELTNLGPRGFLATEVRSIALTGRHSVSQHWAVSYDLSWNQQGDIYSRKGVRFGVRYNF